MSLRYEEKLTTYNMLILFLFLFLLYISAWIFLLLPPFLKWVWQFKWNEVAVSVWSFFYFVLEMIFSCEFCYFSDHGVGRTLSLFHFFLFLNFILSENGMEKKTGYSGVKSIISLFLVYWATCLLVRYS